MTETSALNFKIKGEGLPVILIHGMAASMYDWVSLETRLVNSGYQAITLDLLGHGDSPKPDNPDLYSYKNIYKLTDQWISSLKLDRSPWLIGHSLGGLLCLTHGIDHQEEVQGIVLIDPFYHKEQLSPIIRMANHRPDIWGKAMEMVPTWLINTFAGWEIKANQKISDLSRRQIAEDYKRASPHILQITKKVPNLEKDLSKLDIPILVIWGQDDLTLNPKSFSSLVESLPNATGQAIPDCGHQPHLSKPAIVNSLIMKFINKHSADPKLWSQ